MKYQLTAKDIETIEKAINRSGSVKIEITIKNGEIAVYQVESKRLK